MSHRWFNRPTRPSSLQLLHKPSTGQLRHELTAKTIAPNNNSNAEFLENWSNWNVARTNGYVANSDLGRNVQRTNPSVNASFTVGSAQREAGCDYRAFGGISKNLGQRSAPAGRGISAGSTRISVSVNLRGAQRVRAPSITRLGRFTARFVPLACSNGQTAQGPVDTRWLRRHQMRR